MNWFWTALRVLRRVIIFSLSVLPLICFVFCICCSELQVSIVVCQQLWNFIEFKQFWVEVCILLIHHWTVKIYYSVLWVVLHCNIYNGCSYTISFVYTSFWNCFQSQEHYIVWLMPLAVWTFCTSNLEVVCYESSEFIPSSLLVHSCLVSTYYLL